MHIWSDAVDTFCAANVILADAFHRHFDSCRDEQSVPQSYRSIATAFKKIEYDINNVLRPTVKVALTHSLTHLLTYLLTYSLITIRKCSISDVLNQPSRL